ncbi:apoptosis-associated speck-like protein containing a CARD isoform X1 [Nerophis ophidion]|uniref:apoptosis-associated speck-like protein containing a CARD isoform X1 n=1 Tax=Nerophis ophidion TaxID=159077 RepID=UPI002AE02D95|nr:apoptosis-associated speck-like protein containing a CARD isoform X1 [Nerophis ophidion]
MASNKKIILNTLENLSKANFEKFCQALVDRRGDRRVPLSKVEGKNFLAVTNVLVSTFTEAGAPAVTSELLRDIDCLDDAENLDAKCMVIARRPAGGADGVSTGSSIDNEDLSKGQHFVDKHKLELTKRVTNISAILDQLLDKKVIQAEVYELILRMNVNQQKMREIYLRALQSGDKAKDVFLEILEKEEPYLVADLRQNK